MDIYSIDVQIKQILDDFLVNSTCILKKIRAVNFNISKSEIKVKIPIILIMLN